MANVVAILGSRTYRDLYKVLVYVNKLPPNTLIVSGGAAGVDTIAEQAARHRRDLHFKAFTVESFEWRLFGKRAGPIRNRVLLQYIKAVGGSVAIFACRDGENLTKGSQNVLDLCNEYNIPYSLFLDEN